MGVLSTESLSIAAAVGLAVYIVWLAVYRLYIDPIAKFPGPRLAALTFWYEFYHDVVRGGMYEFEIAKMHKEYGPIVRISPYELHIDDPDYLDVLYPGSSGGGSSKRIEKWPWVMKQFGTGNSTFGTCDHNLHRMRRSAIAPLLSKRSVVDLESFIQNYLDKLMDRLRNFQGSGTPVNLVDAFSSLTGDIISDYSFGRPSGWLDDPEFTPKWHRLVENYGQMGHLCRQFGFVMPAMDMLPTSIAEKMNPTLTEITKLYRLISRQITEVNKERDHEGADDMKGTAHRTVFREILDSDLPDNEKEVARLKEEGMVLMVAGTATTADTLSTTSFYLLQNPDILRKLQNDLRTAKSSKLQDLEQLPYLTAVAKEGLRITSGVCQRLQRIHPDTDLRYNEWIIPRGTPVGISPWLVHTNKTKFPEPKKFRPERWLGQSSQNEQERLEKYLFSFGRGTRQCVGLNLAWAELYMTLAAMFKAGSLQFELFETDETDVEMAKDSFVPQAKDDSKGIRVLVK